MTEVAIFRMIVCIFVICSVPLVLLLLKTPAGPVDAKTVYPILGASLLAFCSALPYLGRDRKTQFTNLVMFRDSEDGALVAGPFHGVYCSEYTALFWGMTGGGTQNQTKFSVPKELEKKQLEAAIIYQILRDFNNLDWDADVANLTPVYGTGRGTMSEHTEAPTDVIDESTLLSLFKGNELIQSKGFNGKGIRVPKGVKLTVNHGKWKHTDPLELFFENSDFKIGIAAVGYSGGTVNGGVWGIFEADKNNRTRYEQTSHNLVVIGETKRFCRYSANIKSYWKWYDRVSQSMAVFDWSRIDKLLVDQQIRANNTELPEF